MTPRSTTDLEDLAVAVGVLAPPRRTLPRVGEWAAGAILLLPATIAVISFTALWEMLP